jgi:hypothetical protein
MRAIRLLWVEPPDALQGYEADVDEDVFDRGRIERSADDGFAGPCGTYRLLTEECWRTIVPTDPVPIFLHESYEAELEQWVNSLPDAAAEVTIVARVRDAVMQLVETRLAADPLAFSASPTVTTTEPTPRGMAVVGRGVVLRPSRSLDRWAPPPSERRPPRDPRT